MGVLNRSAVVITPRQPYLDWVKRDDTTGVAELVFETLRREPHGLTDKRQWPTPRTRPMFHEWFDVQMCPAVEDLHLDGELIELV